MELVGTFAGPAAKTFHGFHRVDEFLEQLGVVDVGGGGGGRERDAPPVDQQVVLGPGPAAVYGAGTGLLAPLLAGTLAESREALDQSMRPARPSRSLRTRSRRRQTPAFCQSLSLRQQVTPLPQPSSRGSIPQGMPVFST